jgi:hypothetical protein
LGVSIAPEHVPRPTAAKPWDLGLPVTERILGRIGEPRPLWILLWASSAVLAPLVLLAVLNYRGESGRVSSVPDLVIAQVVLAYVVMLCLWGVGQAAFLMRWACTRDAAGSCGRMPSRR